MHNTQPFFVKTAREIFPNPSVVRRLSTPVFKGFYAAREFAGVMPSVPPVLFTNHVGQALRHQAGASEFCATVSNSDPGEQLISQAIAL